VACRSQDNPRRTVPDGVPPGAVNLGFSAPLLSKAVRPAPQAVRPAHAGSFGELIFDNPLLAITVGHRQEERDHGEYQRTQ
jgi:hypothetical protein